MWCRLLRRHFHIHSNLLPYRELPSPQRPATGKGLPSLRVLLEHLADSRLPAAQVSSNMLHLTAARHCWELCALAQSCHAVKEASGSSIRTEQPELRISSGVTGPQSCSKMLGRVQENLATCNDARFTVWWPTKRSQAARAGQDECMNTTLSAKLHLL
jgi:hypothetical protein